MFTTATILFLMAFLFLDMYAISLTANKKQKKLKTLAIVFTVLFLVSFFVCVMLPSLIFLWIIPILSELVILIIWYYNSNSLAVQIFAGFFICAFLFGFSQFISSDGNIALYKHFSRPIDTQFNEYPLFQYFEQEDGDYCIELANEYGNLSFNTYAYAGLDKIYIGATIKDVSYVQEKIIYWANGIQEKVYTIFISVN